MIGLAVRFGPRADRSRWTGDLPAPCRPAVRACDSSPAAAAERSERLRSIQRSVAGAEACGYARSEDHITDKPVFDYAARWQRAAALMEQQDVDALLLMKPANLAYFTGDGRPCALALLTRTLHCVVAVPACILASIRRTSVATEPSLFPERSRDVPRLPRCIKETRPYTGHDCHREELFRRRLI